MDLFICTGDKKSFIWSKHKHENIIDVLINIRTTLLLLQSLILIQVIFFYFFFFYAKQRVTQSRHVRLSC